MITRAFIGTDENGNKAIYSEVLEKESSKFANIRNRLLEIDCFLRKKISESSLREKLSKEKKELLQVLRKIQ